MPPPVLAGAASARLAEYCAVLRVEPRRFQRWVSSPVLVLTLPIRHQLWRAVDPSTRTLDSDGRPVGLHSLPEVKLHTSRIVVPLASPRRSDFQIGRGTSCDLSLRFDSVSRVHAFIERRGESYFLRDADSKNGTFVNGERILPEEPVELGDDAHVLFGEVEAEFLLPDAFRMELNALARPRGVPNRKMAAPPSPPRPFVIGLP